MSSSTVNKQRQLATRLYRGLYRWSQEVPPNASLIHLDQSIDGTIVETPEQLRSLMRTSFRKAVVPVKYGEKEEDVVKRRVQLAMEGFKFVNSIDPKQKWKMINGNGSDNTDSNDLRSRNIHNKFAALLPKHWLESVEWLPPIDEMPNEAVEPSHLPLFPLSGPLLPTDSDHLPLFSQFSDVPVAGMEIPLKIFEPRYRQLYQDVMANGKRQVIVPFCHPHDSATFAQYGWLYEVMRVQDVADETSGQVQFLCHHLVTKPVRISSIVNPSDWNTKYTYLRAQAEVVQDDPKFEPKDLQPVERLLRKLKESYTEAQSKNAKSRMNGVNGAKNGMNGAAAATTTTNGVNGAAAATNGITSDHNDEAAKLELINRLLSALAENDLWSVVHVWITDLQMQVLQLQVKIAATIQSNVKTDSVDGDGGMDNNTEQQQQQPFVDNGCILEAQEPHRQELESLLMELSTLVPLLLQDSSSKEQCRRLYSRIKERLVRK